MGNLHGLLVEPLVDHGAAVMGPHLFVADLLAQKRDVVLDARQSSLDASESAENIVIRCHLSQCSPRGKISAFRIAASG